MCSGCDGTCLKHRIATVVRSLQDIMEIERVRCMLVRPIITLDLCASLESDALIMTVIDGCNELVACADYEDRYGSPYLARRIEKFVCTLSPICEG